MLACPHSLPVDEPAATAAAGAVKSVEREVASRVLPSSGVPAVPSVALVAASLVLAGAAESVAGAGAVDGTWATASWATGSELELACVAPCAGEGSPVADEPGEAGVVVPAG